MNEQINITVARKRPFANPQESEAITARRHQLRSELCLHGWDWHAANAESWRMARLAQHGGRQFAAALALFSGEAA